MGYIDEVIKEKRQRLEMERNEIKTKVRERLLKIRQIYGIEEAYITGSLNRPFRWNESSDVDIAVSGCSLYILAIMGELEEVSSREVDVILLDEHPAADSIRRNGEKVYGGR